MTRGLVAALLLATLASAAPAQDEKKVPYWASIASGEAMTRAGPGRNYPGLWLYKRRDLPVKVLQVYESWRKIEDPDGEQGWMLVTLMSGQRTAIIRASEPVAVRVKPDPGAAIRYRAEPGVVGRIDHCDGDWCHIAFGPREGYVQQDAIYGTDPRESVE